MEKVSKQKVEICCCEKVVLKSREKISNKKRNLEVCSIPLNITTTNNNNNNNKINGPLSYSAIPGSSSKRVTTAIHSPFKNNTIHNVLYLKNKTKNKQTKNKTRRRRRRKKPTTTRFHSFHNTHKTREQFKMRKRETPLGGKQLGKQEQLTRSAEMLDGEGFSVDQRGVQNT